MHIWILHHIRSIKLDTWTRKQLAMMEAGGNKTARNFFKQHSLESAGDQKYSTTSARIYRQQVLDGALLKLTTPVYCV